MSPHYILSIGKGNSFPRVSGDEPNDTGRVIA